MVTAPHPQAPRDDRPAHVADLLRLVTRDPGRPRLTWYGDDGERVELSGAVLENWVNKTTNLLVEEFDAGPGTRVVLDLPVHWRTVVWALAAWRVGATVVLVAAADDATADDGAAPPDVVVTTHPDRWRGTRAELVAVALPALARRFDGDLPAGAVDAASAVMTYGDRVGWAPAVEPGLEALSAPSSSWDHAHLVERSAGGRQLLAPTPHPGDENPPTASILVRVLATWAADGSVVLVSPTTATALDSDPERLRRLLAQEQATPS
jgi:uncharacterized protein (TIGR03089 family)